MRVRPTPVEAPKVRPPNARPGERRPGIAEAAQRLRVNVSFPSKFSPLLNESARYKVFYGGRGSGKSHSIARALLVRGIREPGLRVLCTREVQSSMRESVHQLLRDLIKEMGIESLYRVLDSEIRGIGAAAGTLFMFKGLADPEAIKSLEGCHICWIEEARVVTKASWEKLDPTIRAEGSEVWISFNPELDTDYLYELFVKKTPPPGAIVVKVNWYDNPYFPTVLRAQMHHMRATDYDNYLHIWEGHCQAALEGAIYAEELRAATKGGRVCRFEPVPGKQVHTFWDLGRSDTTAIWFVQLFGLEYRIIRFYQANGKHISHYTDLLAKMAKPKEEGGEGYVFGVMWLPHDADEKRLSSRRTTRQQVEDAGLTVKIVDKIGVAEGIQAARTIFPYCYFHEEHAGEGIDMLRRYHYEVDPKTKTRSKKPKHDLSSNGADAFRYMGVALQEPKVRDRPKPSPRSTVRPSKRAWMAR